MKKDITSMRSTIEFLKERDDICVVTAKVAPIYEIAGILKAFDGGPALLFENINGYPGTRNVGNIFANSERIARILDIDDPKKIKFKIHDAIRNPIPPIIVDKAPCQEVVITTDIDVMKMMPIIKHTERDAGRIIGGSNNFIGGKYFRGGRHVGFNRIHFRGRDWASVFALIPTHLGTSARIDHRREKIPMTMNICTPPAVNLVAGGGQIHTIIPRDADEVAIAGGLQGFPVELCKAKTVDAEVIAQSEWVIEGYLDTTQRVWESEEAEKIEQWGKAPFFPEWPGYLGRCTQALRFQATAITHRKDRPIFYTPLAHSLEGTLLGTHFKEACFYELAERIIPGLVVDVNIPYSMKMTSGVVFQVKKTRERDEGWQRNLLMAAHSSQPSMTLAIIVDEDVDIYSADELLWAITTRVNPASDIIVFKGVGNIMLPIVRVGEAEGGHRYEGGMGIDATVPFRGKWTFERPKYPIHLIDLSKWFSPQEIERVRAQQSEYCQLLARNGW
jgi:4-hydroxy-3-polyprenylbenzoate decarboxylase